MQLSAINILVGQSSAVHPKDTNWKQCFLIHNLASGVRDLFWEDSKGILLPWVAKLGMKLVTSWLRSQISNGSLTSNEQLIVYIIACRASESEAAFIQWGGNEREVFVYREEHFCG